MEIFQAAYKPTKDDVLNKGVVKRYGMEGIIYLR